MLFQHKETMRRLGNDPDLLKEFIQIFREDSPGLVASMREAVANGNPVAFHDRAHALKGLVSNFGAEEAVAFAAEMESAQFGAGCADTMAGIDRLEAMLKNLDAELESGVDN